MSSQDNMPIPEAALRDPKSREMIRAWVAEEALWCSINIGTWDGVKDVEEPTAWGILLADVARHVANALEELKGSDKQRTISDIREAIMLELSDPTSGHRGDFV